MSMCGEEGDMRKRDSVALQRGRNSLNFFKSKTQIFLFKYVLK